MEALTQALHLQALNNKIQLHPKCKDPSIVTLAFADDLIIFTKPTPASLKCIMSTLEAFATFTGLHINLEKSHILYSGLTQPQADHVLSITKMSVLNNSTSYLGIPHATKSHTNAQCAPLYEKITSLLSSWQNRFLSQAGRLTIINSIVFSMCGYWRSTFLLPCKLVAKIRSALICFLWTGTAYKRYLAPISSSKLELPKPLGGLNIKNISIWNKAAFSKHFDAFLNKKQTLWTVWARAHNLKAHNFWTMEPKVYHSWVWKSVLKLRIVFKPLLYLSISTNSDANFWSSPWLDTGIFLSDVIPHSEIALTGIPYNAKASHYVREGRIVLPTTNSIAANTFWVQYQNVQVVHSTADKYMWGTSKKQHDISIVYNSLAHHEDIPPFPWCKRVWNLSTSERLNFSLWKLLRNAVHTSSNLQFKGIPVNDMCRFCQAATEDTMHLFFACSELHNIWRRLKMAAGYDIPKRCSSHEWTSLYKQTKWKTPYSYELLLILKVFAYSVWKERNNRVFNSKRNSNKQMVNEILAAVHYAMKSTPYSFPSERILLWQHFTAATI